MMRADPAARPGALRGPVAIAGMSAVFDPTGALYWPAADTLVVSDLHLETGSSYARRGSMLPPYDSHATLDRLEAAVRRHRPARIVSLGDSFHDPFGAERMPAAIAARLAALAAGSQLIWVTGNHDRDAAAILPGAVHDAITISGVTFRHIPDPDAADTGPEVAGHYHPAARIIARGLSLRRRCFVGCARRLILPALGVMTGGLNVCDPAYRPFWPELSGLRAFMIGSAGVYPVPSSVLVPG